MEAQTEATNSKSIRSWAMSAVLRQRGVGALARGSTQLEAGKSLGEGRFSCCLAPVHRFVCVGGSRTFGSSCRSGSWSLESSHMGRVHHSRFTSEWCQRENKMKTSKRRSHARLCHKRWRLSLAPRARMPDAREAQPSAKKKPGNRGVYGTIA